MSDLREEIARSFANVRTGGSVYMGGDHKPNPSEYRRADAILAAVAEALTTQAAIPHAIVAYRRTERTSPMFAAITAALREAGITKG